MWAKSVIASFLFLTTISLSTQKSVQWKGYEWFTRDDQNSGPGPNNWSSNNVWVDEDGNLHLKISNSNGGWSCAELYTDVKFGFGTYKWFVEGPIDKLDTNVVLGLFTYGNPDGANEIDIEVAKWGQTAPEAGNYFYTIYPHTVGAAKPVSSGTRISFDEGTYSTHQFIWSPTSVKLQGQNGFMTNPNDQIFFQWETPSDFSSAMPYIEAPLHMNLWLFEGRAPTDGQEVEIVIHDFQYTPA